jgi:hypothetical protein
MTVIGECVDDLQAAHHNERNVIDHAWLTLMHDLRLVRQVDRFCWAEYTVLLDCSNRHTSPHRKATPLYLCHESLGISRLTSMEVEGIASGEISRAPWNVVIARYSKPPGEAGAGSR